MPEHSGVYYQTDRRSAIRSYVLNEMMRGAGWSLGVLALIGLFLWAVYGIGLLLPPESKMAPPPMPFSQMQPLQADLA